MKIDLSGIIAAAKKRDDLDDSLVNIIKDLAAEVRAVSQRLASTGDIESAQAELDSLAGQMNAKSQEITDAAKANTDVGPEVPVDDTGPGASVSTVTPPDGTQSVTPSGSVTPPVENGLAATPPTRV